jgi:hypothetical protein
MTARHDRPENPLDDDDFWRRLGAESGRRNEPRMPSGESPIRATLRSIWTADLHQERVAVLDALEALDSRRANIKRRLHEVHAQSSADPRQAAAVPIMLEKDRELAMERVTVCDRFRQTVEAITHRAHECDAIWRSANERDRDRRMSIEPTVLDIPADLVDLPSDPFV